MIPLRDKNQTQRLPFVTVLLIIINISVFLYQVSLGKQLEPFLEQFGIIPQKIYLGVHSTVPHPLLFISFITSLFLHGGWLHLGGNMLYLWVFGDNVEDKLGHTRFVFFYFFCGIAASVLHIYITPHSTLPTIGASGAISGVLGAYLVMFPRARVLTLVPIFIFVQIIELPAFIILGFWFLIQFLNGMLSLGYAAAGMGGVAWWAHTGGFVAGLLLVVPLRKHR